MRARYFCDSCGAAVSARAETCPACGKSFAAVRCPRCGHVGPAADFTKGCKVCGYLAADGDRSSKPRRPGRDLPLSPGVAWALGSVLVVVLVLLVFLVLRR